MNVWAAEVPPPGVGLKTVILYDPAVSKSDAGIIAVNCEALTNVVVLAEPAKLTTEEGIKFVPLTVKVNCASPTAADVGEIEIVVGTGFPPVVTVTIPVVSAK